MTRALIIAALALSGCQMAMPVLPKLPTPAELCAMPAPVRDAQHPSGYGAGLRIGGVGRATIATQ